MVRPSPAMIKPSKENRHLWEVNLMKNQENIMKETSWLINMMSDDLNIHDFYLLKHYVISRIDKSKRAKRKKATRFE